MNYNQYDTILIYNPPIISEDDRLFGEKPGDYAWKGAGYETPDLKLYDAFSFGKVVRNSLNNMGDGYYNKVTDFGKYVSVTIGYHNILTGRSSEKTFLIDFTLKGDGVILSTSNRYRTINGVQQAISYIKSAASTLQNNTNNRS